MEQNDYMDAVYSFGLPIGWGWPSSFGLYATIFVVGLLSRYLVYSIFKNIALHHPAVLDIAAILMLVEFLSVKIPYVDNVWDSLQTFIRIPCRCPISSGCYQYEEPVFTVMIRLLGGSLAGITHATKACNRAIIKTSQEPTSNVVTSLGEEGLWWSDG